MRIIQAVALLAPIAICGWWPSAPISRDQVVFVRYSPDSLPAATASEVFDASKGTGITVVPVMTSQARYVIEYTAVAPTTTTWNYALKLGGVTLFSNSASGVAVQNRRLVIWPRKDRNKVYLTRTVSNESSSATAQDSAAFTDWANPHVISLTIQPGVAAKLLGCKATIEQ